MSKSKFLAAIAILILATAAHAQIVTIGDGVISKGRFNGSDHKPFAKALAQLPKGGVIEVLQGNYTFGQSVPITADGITIRGAAGAQLTPAASGTIGLFDIPAARVRISGIEIVTTTPFAGQSAIHVLGNTFTLDHCTLRALGGAADFRFIDLGDGIVFRRGTLIESNSFLFSDQSAGVIGLRARFGVSLRVAGNTFDHVDGSVAGLCRYCLEFDTESKGTIVGNSFQNLGSLTNMVDAVIWSNSETEGHHFAISGNFFEFCIGQQIIQLLGGRFCAISGNVFGRMTSAVGGTIRLMSSVGGQTGESNLISGNQFHNVALGILVAAQKWAAIDTNQFTLCASRQIDVLNSSQGVAILGNQFVASGLVTISDAIRLTGGSDHMVHDNTALSESASVGFTTLLVNSTADSNVAGNWQS